MEKLQKFAVTLIFLTTASVYPQNLADYEKRITEHTLSNGMHFIILEDHTAPVVTFHTQVNTGSVDEKYGETGASHIIEHLAFNGTAKVGTTNWKEENRVFMKMDRVYEEILKLQKSAESDDKIPAGPGFSKGETDSLLLQRKVREDFRKKESLEKLEEEFKRLKEKAAGYQQPNEFGKLMELQGAVGPNAYTSNDITVYWVELPSNKTELWALLESDRLFNPVFRGFYEELDVIKEERRMRTDNSPWGRLMEEFHNIAYKVHPYRNPVIGYPGDLEEITRTKVKDFYTRHYVPSNIIVVIVGDVEPDKFIRMVERYFGTIPARTHTPSFIPSEPPQKKTEKRVLIKMQAEPLFLTGVHIPDANHPDIPVLEVCAELLAGGRTSRLYQEMVKNRRAAISAGAWCRAQKYPGIFYIWAVPAQGHTNQEMETLILEELGKVQIGEIREEEIKGAKERLKMEFLTLLSSRMGLASELGAYQAITGDWRNLFTYPEKIEKVTVQDIKTVMEKYFIPESRIVGMVERE